MSEEIKTEQPEKRKIDLASYGVVVAFLALEVLAFVSFYLGQSFLLYSILSIVLTILLVLVTFRQIKKDGIATFAFFIFPIFVFGILTMLSNFNPVSSLIDSKVPHTVGEISVAETIFIPIALTMFGFSGYLSGHLKSFKIKTALLVIYSALGIYVFINLVLTMIYYVPFYTLIYHNSYIVYNGKPSVVPIGSMAYMLFGFKIIEVSVEYWSLFPSLLLTAGSALFFLKPKENRREFIIYAILTFIAFLSLLFTISKITLLSDFVLVVGIALIVLAGKFAKSHNLLNGVFIGLGICLLIFFAILFLNAQTAWKFLDGFRNLLNKNSLMTRIFTSNRYSSSVIVIFQDLFTGAKLFGFPHGLSFEYYDNLVPQALTNIWFIDTLMTSGVFGTLFFLFAIGFGVYRMFKWYKSNEETYIKTLVFTYVLGFLVISAMLCDTTPLINSNKVFPFFMSAPLLICLFLIGYCFYKSFETTEEKKVEPVTEKEEKKEEEGNEVISL